MSARKRNRWCLLSYEQKTSEGQEETCLPLQAQVKTSAGWHQLGPRKLRPHDIIPRYRAECEILQKVRLADCQEASFLGKHSQDATLGSQALARVLILPKIRKWEVRTFCKDHNMTPGEEFHISLPASQPQAPHQPQEGGCPGFSKMAQFQIFYPAGPIVMHIRPILDSLHQTTLTQDNANKLNKPRTDWLWMKTGARLRAGTSRPNCQGQAAPT